MAILERPLIKRFELRLIAIAMAALAIALEILIYRAIRRGAKTPRPSKPEP